MLKYKMNKLIQQIHKEQFIIYCKYNQYFVIDFNIYIFKGLFQFHYCLKNGRKIIFIDENYLNYVLKKLKKNDISYVIININCGYDKILEYCSNNNQYWFYYKKGKRVVKNERKIEVLFDSLDRKRNFNLLKEVERIIDDN